MQVEKMNAHYRFKPNWTLFAVVAVLAINVAGCAASQAYPRGSRAELTKDFETAMTEYKAALDRDPRNYEYRLKYEQARYNVAFQHFEAGRRAVDKQDYETAKMEFTRVLEIDPTHALAEQRLTKVNEVLNSRSRKEPEPEIQFEQLKQDNRTDPTPQSQLEPKTRGPIDIHMTQDSRIAFETLAELAGFNVIFDPDFRGTRIQIDLNKVVIIEDLDKAKPEVLVDAVILEVDRNLARTLGIVPPQGTAVSTFGGTGGTGASTGNVNPLNRIPRSSSSFSITIPPATAQFLATSNLTKLLQNPRVRATDGKLASIRIGSQVPIASGSFQPAFVGATGTPVVNFQFVDVGVNLDITPRVLLNREINMTVMVQVRALAGDRNIGGVTQPVLTNRQVQHEIRLAEGETNILGGIITESEAVSLSGIPGLKDIPILRYLFSQEKKTRDSTEIIIMLTPHIVRMPAITETNMRGLYTGSETAPRLRSQRLPAIGGQSPSTAAPPAAPAGQTPAPTPVVP